MRHTRDILMTELWVSVALTLIVVLLFESGLLLPGALANDEHTQLLAGIIMVLAVLGLIPTSLYLFRIKHVRQQLLGDESSSHRRLLFWGTVRMMMLCVPMLANMVFYYVFGENVRFFYLSVICALCLTMVYPNLSRCLAETGIKTKAKDYDPDPTDDNPRSY